MKFNKLSIKDLNLKGKRVLMRVDFNVPMSGTTVVNNTRIKAALPTIKYALDSQAKSVILMSHLGRPGGKLVEKYSLKNVAAELERLICMEVTFVSDCVGSIAEKICSDDTKKLILLENLRFHLEEEGKGVSSSGEKIEASEDQMKEFGEKLSRLGDVYVNDAFGTVHRAHSSIVRINLEQRACGLLIKKELEYFGIVLQCPKRPFLTILGGAKVGDKIPLIENLLNVVDELIICGGIAFTFLKKIKNMKIGNSLFDEKASEIVLDLWEKAKAKGVTIHLPVDFKASLVDNRNVGDQYCSVEEGIEENMMGLDIGLRTCDLFAKVIQRAKTIVWNGPPGLFEDSRYAEGTRLMANAVLDATKTGAVSIIGGGDTAAAFAESGMMDCVSMVSTGGGASLELLEGKTLPGVDYLTDILD